MFLLSYFHFSKNGQLDNQKDEEQQISEVEKLADLKFQRWFPDELSSEMILTPGTVSDHNTSRTSLPLNPIENQPLKNFKQIKSSTTINERLTSTNQDVQSWMSLYNIPERDVGVCSSSTTPRNTTSSGSKTNKNNTTSPKKQIKGLFNELAEDKSQHCSPQGKCETAWGKNQREGLMTAHSDNSRDPLWDDSCLSNTVTDDKISELGAATMDPAINSTYEDIVNILKYMEQEECSSLLKLTSATDISVNAYPVVTSDTNQSTSLPSSGKLKDILSYLDEVDQRCTGVLDSAKTRLQAVKDTTQSTQLQLGLIPRPLAHFKKQLEGDNGQFTATDGWLDRWKKRFDVRQMKINGEALSANSEPVPDFKKHLFDLFDKEGISGENLYNCDEAGLKRQMLDDLLQMSVVDLSHEVLTLRLQLEERTSSISVLQEALTQQRELTLRNTQNTDKELKGRLKEQKQHLEAIIGRHQKFIDQLIADKKVLSEKCESLVRELKGSEDRHATNMRAIEERHSIELHQAKEMHAAAEKLRRERWIDSKTQKIKEMTVKGLEPELQRMNTRHQQELSELRTLHKQELEEIEMRATRRATAQLEQLTAEREEVLTRERNSLKQRFEKQLCEEESRYQEERRRLLADVQREKDRLSEEMERVKQEGEEAKKNLVRDSQRNLERVKSEFKEALDAANRRHQNELKLAKETYDADQEAWMYNYKKHQTAALIEKETELREQMKRERDREIELVIERLETEAVKFRTELEQAADNRLGRLKEKYECEMKELEVLEQQLKNKYTETKSQLMEREDTILSLQANVRQLDKELEEARKHVSWFVPSNQRTIQRKWRLLKRREKKKPTSRVSVEAIDDFDRGVVHRAIYSMYDRNQHVTLDTLLDVLRANPGPDTANIFGGGRTTLYKLLHEIGFSWFKTNGRKVLMEDVNVATKRIAFLREYRKLAAENNNFIFLDETLIFSKGGETTHKELEERRICCMAHEAQHQVQPLSDENGADEQSFSPQTRKKYKIDEMVREYGHQVLRLPSCHCQYNPIELVWENCKGYYKKHTGSNNKFMMQLSEPFGKKPLLDWSKNVDYTNKLINDDRAKEMKMDASEIQHFIIQIGNNESDTDYEEEEVLAVPLLSDEVERAEVKEVVRKELSSQLAALEQEVARTREELAESRVRAQLQLAAKEEKLKALAATKETELQEVYRRVKLAVAKKDESVQQLQKQYEAALERCCHLEDLLEQQRRDFLLK
uniref:Uncharacterized protein n=1 Tax=Timema monikensis TaxID=170555 RepID=A0A7R9EFA8_9NEOP|nr:unnamed protein product [Timema monikensis]